MENKSMIRYEIPSSSEEGKQDNKKSNNNKTIKIRNMTGKN